MIPSRSDRPYGTFARGRRALSAADAPPPAPPAGRFSRLAGRRASAAAAAALVAVLALLFVADGSRQRPVNSGVPLPTSSPSPASLIYDKVAPSVVQIVVKTATGDGGSGSGVVFDDQAEILTSLHVVRDAREIQVTFADGTVSRAEIAASLADNDIALLRTLAPPAKVVPATLGNPGSVRIGDDAYVIGNPFGLVRSLSSGVVSGLDRTVHPPELAKPLTGLIQFDAAVNPGNSGGPLVNSDGEVVGIVAGILNPGGAAQFSGIGFAVTIDVAGGAAGTPPD